MAWLGLTNADAKLGAAYSVPGQIYCESWQAGMLSECESLYPVGEVCSDPRRRRIYLQQ